MSQSSHRQQLLKALKHTVKQILALALWLPGKASLSTAGKPHFTPLGTAKAVTEVLLNEEKPTPTPDK